MTDGWIRTLRFSLILGIGLLPGLSAVPAIASVPNSNSISVAKTPEQSASSEQIQFDEPVSEPRDSEAGDSRSVDIDPAIVEDSPVLQRWSEEVPNVLSEIRNDPSFRTRLRVGYSQFPANEQASGFNVGVEDVFLGRSRLTVSGNYQRTFNGEREAYGADLHYYVLPLGSSINIAPVVGYRHIGTDRYATDGVNVGARLRIIPSRTGAADITLTQSWVAPGTDEEVGISTLSFGYAVTRDVRIATDLEKQNAPARKDSRIAVVLEWML